MTRLIDFATGLCATLIFFIVFGKFNHWAFSPYEQLTTVLLAGFLGLWGFRLMGNFVVEILNDSALWFFTKTDFGKELLTKYKLKF